MVLNVHGVDVKVRRHCIMHQEPMSEEPPAPAPPQPEGWLTLSRTSPRDNQLRQLIVKLDGETLGHLTYGRSSRRPLPAGPHELVVSNTFVWKTVRFHLQPGEEARFQLINRNGRFTWFLVATMGAGPMYITVERETGEDFAQEPGRRHQDPP